MDKSIKLFEDIKICADTFPEEPIMPPIFESENDLNLHNNMSVCALSVLNLINSKNMSKNKIITLNEDVKQSVKQSNYGKKFFGEMYLKLENDKVKKTIFMLDSGADVTLLTYDLLKTLFPLESVKNMLMKSPVDSLLSFSNHSMSVVGMVELYIQWNLEQPPFLMNFFVVDSLQVYFPVVIGLDSMMKHILDTSFELHKNVLKTKFTMKKPYVAEGKLMTCFKNALYNARETISLEPGETKFCSVKLNNVNPFSLNDSVLISYETYNDDIRVTPTLNLLTNKHPVVCVTNLTNANFSKLCVFDVEMYNPRDYRIISPYAEKDLLTRKIINSVSAHKLPLTRHSTIKVNAELSTDQSISSSFKHFSLAGYDTQNVSDLNDLDITKIVDPIKQIEPVEQMSDLEFSPNNIGHGIEAFSEIKDILILDNYPPEIRPYLKEILLESFPNIISRSTYDVGNMSKTLSTYKIVLKKGTKLPKYKKIYFLSGHEKQHIEDICAFLLKFKIISKVNHTDTASSFASPGYLVSRKNLESSARLIINYSLINSVIESFPPIIPDLSTILHSLRNKCLFTITDLSSAYYSMDLDPESKQYTRFCTSSGQYVFNKLSQGLCSSPAVFAELGDRIINYIPIYDKNGELVYEKPNLVKMKYAPLTGVYIFYDDVLIASDLKETYKESVKEHFRLVRIIMERLDFHNAKISIEKSSFCKDSILYLGWKIEYHKLLPDPKRVGKLLAAPFPENKKGIRSFLGLCNTIRSVMPADFFEDINILNPLTSSSSIFEMQDIHKKAFESLKRKLCTREIFSNIICPYSKKILFTDAANSKFGSYSAVLAQVANNSETKVYLPEYLYLNDPIHNYLFDQRLEYEPIPLYLHAEFIQKSKLEKDPTEERNYFKLKLKGFSEDTVKNSLFFSIRSLQYKLGCKLTSISDLKKDLIMGLKPSMAAQKIKDFQFDSHLGNYNAFLKQDLESGYFIDEKMYILEVLPQILRRKCIFISELEIHDLEKHFMYGEDYTNPPFIFGIYKNDKYPIFRPFYFDKNKDFNLKQFEQKLEIVSFWSKVIPEADLNKTINQLEINALILALRHFKKLIAGAECLTFVDNRALFQTFSKKSQDGNPQLNRWCLEILEKFPNIKLKFITSGKNISDYLTRNYVVRAMDLPRFNFKEWTVDETILNRLKGQEFGIQEFQDFVKNNEHGLVKLEKGPVPSVSSLSKVATHVNNWVKPLSVLAQRMSHTAVRNEQKLEFSELLQKITFAEEFLLVEDAVHYRLKNGLIYVEKNNDVQLLLPETMVALFISFYHLTSNHAGYLKLISILKPYYIKLKDKKVKVFLRACYSCSLTNPNSFSHKLGTYPIPSYPGQILVCDLAESLPKSGVYSHLLIIVCPLSDLLWAFPLKSKTSDEVIYIFKYAIFPFFNVKKILSDNGPCFTSNTFLEVLNSLGIEKISIARFSPTSNGLAESRVKYVKKSLKRILAISETKFWHAYIPLIVKAHNVHKCTKTGFSPLQLLYADSENCDSIFNINEIKESSLSSNKKILFDHSSVANKQAIEIVREMIRSQNVNSRSYLNVNRKLPKFETGDYVFVLDRSIVVGVNPSLRTKFSTDVFVVLKVHFSTLTLARCADNFTSIYSKVHVKKYIPHDPEFNIPIEVKDILSIDLQMWDETAFEAIRKFTKFEHPTLAEELNGKDNEGYVLNDDIIDEETTQLFEPIETTKQLDSSIKPGEKQITPTIIPTQKKNTNLVRKKYNLRSNPIPIEGDDENDEEDEDINVISSSKNVAFSA